MEFTEFSDDDQAYIDKYFRSRSRMGNDIGRRMRLAPGRVPLDV